MSPACCAPASETAPTTRLIATAAGLLTGTRSAKINCVSLEMPETGLRSVWPRMVRLEGGERGKGYQVRGHP
jgi:hypothetical protein